MISKDNLINSIFYARKTSSKDENDHLVEVENNISVGVRFYLKDKAFYNILFFHGNAELANEYSDIASFFHSFNDIPFNFFKWFKRIYSWFFSLHNYFCID